MTKITKITKMTKMTKMKKYDKDVKGVHNYPYHQFEEDMSMGIAGCEPSNQYIQIAKKRKVLVVGIDGCRPDALQEARTPNIDSLASNGVSTFEAMT